MPRAKAIRFDDLPLFASDTDLAIAIVGPDPEKRATWLAQLPTLESSGFPRKTTTYGRYRPAVKAFYDQFYCANASAAESSAIGSEDAAWQKRGVSRRRV